MIDQNHIEIIAAVLIAGVLVVAALTDLRHRRIPNPLPLTLFGVWVVLAATRIMSGAPVIDVVVSPLVTALLIFAVTLCLFSRGAMGGGDVKLLSALALYASADGIFGVLIIMGFAGGVIALLILIGNAVGTFQDKRVPYGVAIGLAGLPLCAGPLGLF